MRKNKLFLTIQSAVCILLAALLIVAVVGLYRDGAAAHAENPLAWIFSRAIMAERLHSLAPLFFVGIGLAVTGLILGVKEENGLSPAKCGGVQNRSTSGKTVRTVLLMAAVLLIAAGLFNGSAKDVYGKAIKICTECVGLG